MNRQPLTRRLSVGTLFYKRVFPLAYLAGAVSVLAWGAWNTFLGFEVFRFGEAVWLAAAFVVGYLITRHLSSDLVDEVLDGGDFLLVRNENVEERIPLTEIEAVKESWRSRPPRVEVVLRAPGRLGRVIAFIPTSHSLMPFSRSGICHELNDRIAKVSRSRAKKASTDFTD